MQISNGGSSPAYDRSAVVKTAASDKDDGSTVAASSGKSDGVTQDDAVSISSAGAAAAAQSQSQSQSQPVGNTSAAAGSTASTSNTDGTDSSGDTATDGSADASADASATATAGGAVKSFAYGSLGLDNPDKPPENTNPFYTAGRWLAAGITIGGLISLLI
ncbi:hypothetical protein [Paraburkholderia sp.]|uniref:hypothetical protein n=1 Tax=Paraburkholderia sp. TaxID=1926495 RepID=UPI002388D293|nr:hypothetical protein [Paraburkholderia sp.]MDE1181052.1 hypothetical protein [Paraburkholderia sp.]